MSESVSSRVLVLLFIVCAVLLMQGCKTSKKRQLDPSEYSETDLSLPFDLSGSVNGSSLLESEVTFATITLHPVIRGRVSLSESAATTTTDSQGAYSLRISPEYRGRPAFIQALISDSDQPGASAFKLLLAVPELSPKLTNNITVLTYLAASKLLVSASLGSLEQAAIAISDSNSQVASRFGVIGDLPSLPLANIFNEESWSSSSITSLRYASLGQAVVRAKQMDVSSLSMRQALDAFADEYALYGLVDRSSFAEQTSYADILKQVVAIIDGVSPNDGSVPVLDRLMIELATELGLAEVGEPDVYDFGIAASSSGLGYVDKAKAMVQDIRQVVSSIDIQSIAGLSNITKLLANENPVSDQLEGFGIQVDLSALVSGNDFDYITGALKEVGLAVVDRLACHSRGDCSDQEPTDIQMEHSVQDLSGGRGSHELHNFAVKQLVNGCPDADEPCFVDTDLNIQLDVVDLYFYINSQDGEVQGFSADNAAITINGLLTQGDLVLALESAQPQINLGQLLMGFDSDVGSITEVDSSYIITESQSTVVLPFSLKKDAFDGRQDMSATLSMSVDSMSIDLIDTTNVSYFGSRSTKTVISETKVNQLKNFRLDITGVVNNLSDENFLVSINAAQPGLGFEGEAIYRQTTVEDCESTYDPDTCIETDLGTEFVGETVDVNPDGSSHFVRLDVSVGYKAILKGVADPVIVQFSVSRESTDQATINGLKVSYPGHSLNLKGTFTKSGYILSMGATNLDGIVMSIDTVEGAERYGSLLGPDGAKLAVITPTTDLVHIAFDDGYFVSF